MEKSSLYRRHFSSCHFVLEITCSGRLDVYSWKARCGNVSLVCDENFNSKEEAEKDFVKLAKVHCFSYELGSRI